MTQILQLREVSKHYSSHKAVDDVSVEVERGAFFALLGPSGCGKTTTLRLIAGFEQPTAGEVWLDGVQINRLKPYERDVSTVFQNYALFPHLTVRENIEFGLNRRKAKDVNRKLSDVVDLVHLGGKEDRYPAELSGGEKQRVALARSLVLQPKVLLLDEPLSALDPNLRRQVRSDLKQLQRQVGITFVFVTHDQEEALSLSDRIALMNNGKLEQLGSPEDLYRRPATRFAAAFLGSVNWIGGVGVRPEATRIGMVPPPGERVLSGTVQQSMFFGSSVQVHVRTASGEALVAEMPHSAVAPQAGTPVHLWWNPADELHLPDSR